MKSKKILILMAVLIILLVVGTVAFAYVYLATDVFKTNSQLYAKYSGETMNTIYGFIFDENMRNSIKSYESKKSTNSYEFDGSLNVDVDIENQEDNTDFKLNDNPITISGKADPNNRKSMSTVNINYSNTEKFSFDYIINNDLYAVASPEIVNMNIGIENNNLKQLADKLGLNSDVIPDKFEYKEYTRKLESDQLISLKDKYMNLIKSELTEENFSKEEQNQTVYVLTIYGEQLKSIITKITQELKNEQLIIETLDSTEAIEEYQKELDDLVKNIQDEDFSNVSLKISAYIPVNQVHNMQIEMITKYSITTVNISSSNANEINVKYKVDYTFNNSNQNDLLIEDDGDEINEVDLVLSKNVTEDSISYSIRGGIARASIGVTAQVSGLTSNNPIESIKMEYNHEEYGKATATLANKIAFKEVADIPELTSDNTVFLNTYEEEYGGNLLDLINQLSEQIVKVNSEKIERVSEKAINGEENGLFATILNYINITPQG